jgi:hypothetical protein
MPAGILRLVCRILGGGSDSYVAAVFFCRNETNHAGRILNQLTTLSVIIDKRRDFNAYLRVCSVPSRLFTASSTCLPTLSSSASLSLGPTS